MRDGLLFGFMGLLTSRTHGGYLADGARAGRLAAGGWRGQVRNECGDGRAIRPPVAPGAGLRVHLSGTLRPAVRWWVTPRWVMGYS